MKSDLTDPHRVLLPQEKNEQPVLQAPSTFVPWNIRDLVAAVFFFAITVITALAFGETARSAKEGDSAELIVGGAVTAGLTLLIVGVMARISRLRTVPVVTAVLAVAAFAVVLSLAGGGILDEQNGDVAGVPTVVFFFALVEGTLLATGLIFTRYKYGASLAAIGFVRTRGVRPYGVAIGYWLLAILAIGLWAVAMRLLGFNQIFESDSAEDALDIAGGSLPLAIALVGIWGPIGEEVFFRGFVLSGLRNRFGLKTSVLLSSVLFGAVHVAPGAIIPTFFLGLAFAFIYVRTKSLWPVIFAHSLQNSLALVAASLSLGS